MSGGAYVEASTRVTHSNRPTVYTILPKKQNNGDIGLTNTKIGNNSSNLNSTYVYGSIPVQRTGHFQNTTHVQGGSRLPFNANIADNRGILHARLGADQNLPNTLAHNKQTLTSLLRIA